MGVLEAVVFDLDDTLLRFDGVSEPAWRKAVDGFVADNPLIDGDAIVTEIRNVGRWFYDDPDRHRIGRNDLLESRRFIARTAFEILRLKMRNTSASDRTPFDDRDRATEIADTYSVVREEMVEPFPGVYETLRSLKRSGIKLALITNGEAGMQRGKVERFELGDYFGQILIEGEIGFGKPDERIYRELLGRLESPAEKVVIVGDNLEWEILAPARLGFRTIWHDWRGGGLPEETRARPDYIVRSIPEVVKIVEGLS